MIKMNSPQFPSENTEAFTENTDETVHPPVPMQPEMIPPKKVFSRFALSIAICYIVSTVLSSICMIIMQSVGLSQNNFLGSTSTLFLVTDIPLYCIGIPLIWLMLRKIPVSTAKPQKLPAPTLIKCFLISISSVFVGNILSGILSSLLTMGRAQNAVSNALSSVEIISSILLVICAPIMEELVFRKWCIDRLSPYGEVWAVLFSAICFSLFHMNLYQFFYTFALGLVSGYIYVRSRKIIYSILLHALLNLTTGVIAPLATSGINYDTLEEIQKATENGQTISPELISSFLPGFLTEFAYLSIFFIMVLVGFILFIISIKKIHFEPSTVLTTKSEGLRAMLLNVGAIIFIILSVISSIANLVLSFQ